MLELIEISKEEKIGKLVKREQDVIADQYDRMKEVFCDQIDEAKNYHMNRLAILAQVISEVK